MPGVDNAAITTQITCPACTIQTRTQAGCDGKSWLKKVRFLALSSSCELPLPPPPPWQAMQRPTFASLPCRKELTLRSTGVVFAQRIADSLNGISTAAALRGKDEGTKAARDVSGLPLSAQIFPTAVSEKSEMKHRRPPGHSRRQWQTWNAGLHWVALVPRSSLALVPSFGSRESERL